MASIEQENVVPSTSENETEETNQKKNLKILLGVLGGLIVACTLLYFLWLRPMLRKPISEPLALPTVAMPNTTQINGVDEPLPEAPSNLTEIPFFTRPTPEPRAQLVCGKDAEWIVLMVGIDYRGDDFLYGLADVIRVIRIDFVNMTVNMVNLPRDLLVEAPEGRFTEPDPYKINQAYLFGTTGWNGYLGSGQGAGALAEVIQHNFGITTDHYGVINFVTFINFIDAIGGIEVDLPGPISGNQLGDFPAGRQTLDGKRALALSRIRYGYGDAFRVRNQTIIMRAVLNKLIQPAYIVQVPSLLNKFSGAFLTDLSIEQLGNIGGCFLRNFDNRNLQTFEAPRELLTSGRAFIPTLNGNAFVYRWDEQLIEWIYDSLLEK
jgi:LCP family protein required for cell wall assembly